MAKSLVDNERVYSLSTLVIIWTFSFLAELAAIALEAFEIYYAADQLTSYSDCSGTRCTSGYSYYYYGNRQRPTASLISASFIVALAAISLLVRIVQIVFYTRASLTPTFNFWTELSRFLIWLALLIWVIIAELMGISRISTSIIVVPIAWIFALLPMIYASVIFSRFRRGIYNGPNPNHGGQYLVPSQYSYGHPQLIPGHGCPTCGAHPSSNSGQTHNIQEHYRPEKRSSQPSAAPVNSGVVLPAQP